VRRESRWTPEDETPARELVRSTRQPKNDARVLAPDSFAIRPEWFMPSEDAARATDALQKLRRHRGRGVESKWAAAIVRVVRMGTLKPARTSH